MVKRQKKKSVKRKKNLTVKRIKVKTVKMQKCENGPNANILKQSKHKNC